jgi:hypothetical protein
MSDSESFLKRWSRRKQSAEPAPREAPETPGDAARQAQSPADDAVPPEPAAVDSASLPPIDSIGPGSDVGAFLQAGVPADLTRAALRRAWSTEAGIRDFIGLSENAWDFNAPDSAAGFGALSADDVRRLLDHMIDTPAGAGPVQSGDRDGDRVPPAPDQERPSTEETKAAAATTAAQRAQDDIAAQQNPDNNEYEPILVRRGHGGAVPE